MTQEFPQLQVPVIAAPMAGGPSTPELVAAVCEAGGFGFLAAGYKSAQDVTAQIARTRELTQRPFGLNVFVPTSNDEGRDGAAIQEYAGRLAEVAETLGTSVGSPRWDDTDGFADKIDVLERECPAVVSFMFGVPDASTIERLHAVGCCVMVTVTDADDALAASRAGVDVLCVQGAEAGGHRGTHRVDSIPGDQGVQHVLREVRSVTALPLVAAGGVVSADQSRHLLDQGAIAVQCGTAFLLVDEAGTSAAHRAGLTNGRFESLAVTRSFSGRPAQGLRNGFISRFDASAPPVFPIVDQLTKPLRAAAAAREDPDNVSLWAGRGWRHIHSGPAASIVGSLAP